MNYKLCILAAGKGTRNKYSKDTNKALLPLGEGTALSYIISKFPEDIEIIIAVGHNAIQVENYLLDSVWKWDREIKCKEVKYEGEGTGPGYSLLQCAPLLQCPFIYTACDTIVNDDIPPPDKNWIGVSLVNDTLPYLTMATEKGLVTHLYEKGAKNPTILAHIGLVGVKDYKTFWKGLSHPIIAQNEYQDTSGISALIKHTLHRQFFHWKDIGTTEGYENAKRHFDKTLSS